MQDEILLSLSEIKDQWDSQCRNNITQVCRVTDYLIKARITNTMTSFCLDTHQTGEEFILSLSQKEKNLANKQEDHAWNAKAPG